MIEKDLQRCISDAVLELCYGEEALKGRLLAAVRALRIVLIRQKKLPSSLRKRAQEISDELSSYELPELSEGAIAAMDTQSARRLAERILHLYAECRMSSSADNS